MTYREMLEAVVDSMAHAVYAHTRQNPFRDVLTEDVDVALRHAGLPALLERVEAAEDVVAVGAYGAALEQTKDLRNQLARITQQAAGLRRERDALAATIAEASRQVDLYLNEGVAGMVDLRCLRTALDKGNRP